MQNSLNILVQGFSPLKIKITQFPGGFRLKLTTTTTITLFKERSAITYYSFLTYGPQVAGYIQKEKACKKQSLLWFYFPSKVVMGAMFIVAGVKPWPPASY